MLICPFLTLLYKPDIVNVCDMYAHVYAELHNNMFITVLCFVRIDIITVSHSEINTLVCAYGPKV